MRRRMNRGWSGPVSLGAVVGAGKPVPWARRRGACGAGLLTVRRSDGVWDCVAQGSLTTTANRARKMSSSWCVASCVSDAAVDRALLSGLHAFDLADLWRFGAGPCAGRRTDEARKEHTEPRGWSPGRTLVTLVHASTRTRTHTRTTHALPAAPPHHAKYTAREWRTRTANCGKRSNANPASRLKFLPTSTRS